MKNLLLLSIIVAVCLPVGAQIQTGSEIVTPVAVTIMKDSLVFYDPVVFDYRPGSDYPWSAVRIAAATAVEVPNMVAGVTDTVKFKNTGLEGVVIEFTHKTGASGSIAYSLLGAVSYSKDVINYATLTLTELSTATTTTSVTDSKPYFVATKGLMGLAVRATIAADATGYIMIRRYP